MDFIYYCPYCKQKLECDESLEGAMLNCPACNEVIQPKKPAPQIRVARDNAPMPQMPIQQYKKRLTYILLGLFLGGLGIHNFYAGYRNEARGQLALGIISFITFFADTVELWVFLIICGGVWSLVNIALRDKDSNGNPMVW